MREKYGRIHLWNSRNRKKQARYAEKMCIYGLLLYCLIKMLSEERLLKLLACQHLIALEIFIDRLLNDIVRQSPVVVRVSLQPVAGELFVKGRLSVSRLVSVCRPEA